MCWIFILFINCYNLNISLFFFFIWTITICWWQQNTNWNSILKKKCQIFFWMMKLNNRENTKEYLNLYRKKRLKKTSLMQSFCVLVPFHRIRVFHTSILINSLNNCFFLIPIRRYKYVYIYPNYKPFKQY